VNIKQTKLTNNVRDQDTWMLVPVCGKVSPTHWYPECQKICKFVTSVVL